MLEQLGDILILSRFDFMGAILWVIIFPCYHAIYPHLVQVFSNRASRAHIDPLRRSWIEGLVARRDMVLATQQTRNLTMVNSLLATSSLLLMGVTVNLLIRRPESVGLGSPSSWSANSASVDAKLFLLMVVFAVAFAYCMTSLRHLGHFSLVIGADPEVIRKYQGDPVDYLTGLVAKASSRHTMAVRTLYSASPIMFWIFDTPTFVVLNLLWAVKFWGFQDFVSKRAKRKMSLEGAQAVNTSKPLAPCLEIQLTDEKHDGSSHERKLEGSL